MAHFLCAQFKCMRVPKPLVDLIEPIVVGLGYECAGIEYVPHGKHGLLRVYIDSETGILLDDCSKVSHQLSGALDVEDPIPGHYQLEVSSPGLDRRLFTIKHFERFKNNTVYIQLAESVNQRRRITGKLINVKNDTLTIEEDGMQVEIPFRLVEKARLVPDSNHLPNKG